MEHELNPIFNITIMSPESNKRKRKNSYLRLSKNLLGTFLSKNIIGYPKKSVPINSKIIIEKNIEIEWGI